MRSNKPKVLHAFAGKTFLNRVMDSVAVLNPDTLAVVVHFRAERVAEAARSYDEQVTIVNQTTFPVPAAPCSAQWHSSPRLARSMARC